MTKADEGVIQQKDAELTEKTELAKNDLESLVSNAIATIRNEETQKQLQARPGPIA